jgi:SH3-like domain-containing protein
MNFFRWLAVAAAVALGGTLFSAPPAQAGGPSYIGSNTGGANARRCASTNCKVFFYLKNGRPVNMICWIDAQYIVGDYGSQRWFDVQTLDSGARGFVHSSLVENQTNVRVCKNNDANSA